MLVAVALSGAMNQAEALLTEAELQKLLDDARGDDTRLMRWNASRHTRKRQDEGGCNSLGDVLDIVTNSRADQQLKGIACEFATFCITDNPGFRAAFSKHSGIHSAVVNLLHSSNTYASAMAGHLIYIASFSNAANDEGFAKAGAVSALSSALKNKPSTNLQLMWNAAALQNLAASYCDTEHDGRCYWDWKENVDHVIVTEDSLPMISDGSAVRREMVKDAELVKRLNELACTGPVKGKKSSSNPFPGDNAVAGKDDDSLNIVAWAAAGALKNLALEPSARASIETVMPCMCRLSHSADWLEENKGGGAIHHLRRDDPCWFGEKGDKYTLCVDHIFLDDEGYTCTDYEDASEKECRAKDAASGVPATKACCECGGGDRDGSRTEEEL